MLGPDAQENRRRVKGLRCMPGRLPQLAESCGKLQARCGKPKAVAGILRLRRASFATEMVLMKALMPHDARNSGVTGKLGRQFNGLRRIRGDARAEPGVVRVEIQGLIRYLTSLCDSRRARTLTAPTSLAANRRQLIRAIFLAGRRVFCAAEMRQHRIRTYSYAG
jgi:hypothetical protein